MQAVYYNVLQERSFVMAQTVTKTKMLNIRTTEENYQAVQNVARFEGKSISDFVLDTIIEKLEEWEDAQAIREYEKNANNGRVKYYTLDEVIEECGLKGEI
jgi:predicted DNA-binding protein